MSQSVIGALRVNLGLDSAQFEKGAKRVKSPIAGLRSQFQAMAAAASAAGVALGALGADSLNSAREIKRFSQVANATPELFQRWAAGAETVGIEQEKLADILKDVNDRVGDFITTGGGPMADFFENIAPKVGVTADEFARLSGPEALQLYVSSLEKAGVSQQEMTFYLEAMASDATALIPLLTENGAAMEALGNQAQLLGAIMDRDTLEAFGRTQESLTQISKSIGGLKNIIAAGLAPQFEAMAAALSAALQPGAALRTVLETLAEWAGFTFRALVSLTAVAGVRYVAAVAAARLATLSFVGALTAVKAAIIRTGIGALVVGAGELVYQFTRLVDGAGGFGNALTLLGNIGSAAFSEIQLAGAALQSVMGAVAQGIAEKFLRAFKAIFDAWDDLVNAMVAPFNSAMEYMGSTIRLEAVNPIGDALGGLADKAERAGVASAKMAGQYISQMTETKAAVKALTDALNGMADGVDTEEARDEIKRLRDEITDTAAAGGAAAAGAVEDVEPAVEKVSNSANAMQSSFESAFVGIATGAKSAKGALTDLLDSLAELAVSAVFQQFVAPGLTEGFDSLFGGVDGARANGGPVSGGSTYLVGERGPELFTPGSSGGITPNHALGGTNVEVNIINPPSQPTVQKGPNGRIDVMFDQQVAQAIEGGSRTGGAMQRRFGMRPVT